MTTFPLRASGLPNAQTARPVLARIAAVFAAVADVLAEAVRQADAAHNRLTWR
jgi:hypothetical protein